MNSPLLSKGLRFVTGSNLPHAAGFFYREGGTDMACKVPVLRCEIRFQSDLDQEVVFFCHVSEIVREESAGAYYLDVYRDEDGREPIVMAYVGYDDKHLDAAKTQILYTTGFAKQGLSMDVLRLLHLLIYLDMFCRPTQYEGFTSSSVAQFEEIAHIRFDDFVRNARTL